MKFLHTADWQIGMRAGQLGDKGESVRAVRLESARRVVETARQEAVDFLLVAGDTFEHNGVERIKIREAAKILGAAPCPVYVIPGNHDPAVAGSVWEDESWGEWPNVHVITAAGAMPIPGGTLYPCPVTAGDSRDDPTEWIAAGGDGIAIGMAHGSVETAAYGGQPLPIPRDAPELRGLDYLALGHFHSYTPYAGRDGTVRMAYSGTHESTAFAEHDSGNVLIVYIPGRGAPAEIRSVRTGRLEWLPFRRKIEQPGQLSALANELDQLPDPERKLVECTVEGMLFGPEDEMLSHLLEIVEGRFLFGCADVSRLVPDEAGPGWIEELPPGYLREAARELLEAARGAEPDPAAALALRQFSRIWKEVTA